MTAGARALATLSSERWKALEPLVDAALDLPRQEWPAFLDSACMGDATLRVELERLLDAYDRPDTLLEHPAAQRFASLLGVVAVPPPAIINSNYRIERKLGQGGMATVYLAHDARHDRKVAVKVLHPELSAAFRAEQFLSEIRTMAQLQHPHILQLHDSGEVDGLLYYVMPYVEGESLRQRIDREGQLGAEDVVRLTGEVAGALDSAHRHGVVHRDIKPENILLGEGGALIADFGIALAISTASARGRSQPGWIAGTPRYMSPEQRAGSDAIDGRSDVYALGVVAYEMLTGQPPFAGATVTAILAGAVDDAPPPAVRSVRGAISPMADAVVSRAMARAPEDRYPTAGDFAEALERSLAVRRMSRLAIAAVAVLILAAAAVGTALVRRQSAASAAAPTFSTSAPLGPHQTKNLAAYDLYQRSQDQMFARSDSGMKAAIKILEQAIAYDSTYAAAYAALAHLYFLQGEMNDDPKVRAAFEAAALKAVALDDSLPAGHVQLSRVRLAHHDTVAAGAELRRAVALDPANGETHIHLALYLCKIERPSEALAEGRRAAELDPRSVRLRVGMVALLDCTGRYDEALALVDTLRQIEPPLGGLDGQAAHLYMVKGMWPEALTALRNTGETGGPLGRVLAKAGHEAEARRMLAEFIALDRREHGQACDIAQIYEGLDHYDSLFVWLDKAIDERCADPSVLRDPQFDRLRADPRYERIRQRQIGAGLER